MWRKELESGEGGREGGKEGGRVNGVVFVSEFVVVVLM